MEIPPPPVLLEQIHALDGFAALAPRLPSHPPIHLVGGAVRDLLLGRAPRELDLLVEGDAGALASRLGGEAAVHPRFGTATVELDGHTVDLATARRERYPRPGALPEVEPGGLADDLARRDFTINAIAVALNGDRRGAWSAVPRAAEDLEGGRLRVLHDESFRDDPTRLLRLVRYASRLGFAAEARTAALAEQARDGGALGTVSEARILAELRLLAQEPDPVAAFTALREAGLDRAIDPDLGIAEPDGARQALTLLGGAGSPERLVLALAVAATGRGARIRTALSAPEAAIARAVADAGALAARLAAAGRPSEIAAAAGDAPAEAVAVAGARGAPAAARRWLEELRHIRSELTGEDLLAAGIPAGPAIGAGLRAARAARLDGHAASRESELAEALRVARRHR